MRRGWKAAEKEEEKEGGREVQGRNACMFIVLSKKGNIPHWLQCFQYFFFFENLRNIIHPPQLGCSTQPFKPVCNKIYDLVAGLSAPPVPDPLSNKTQRRLTYSAKDPITPITTAVYAFKIIQRTRDAPLTCTDGHSVSEVCQVIPLGCIITLFSLYKSGRMWASCDSIC